MSDFTPNEYLFEKYYEKGRKRGDISAWAVREAIVKAGDFNTTVMYIR